MLDDTTSAYYDLSLPADVEKYWVDLDRWATTWAENFEELGGGDGEPYELGQGLDLWVDIVERWDNQFDGEAVSDDYEARKIGEAVCEEVIAFLVGKRTTDS